MSQETASTTADQHCSSRVRNSMDQAEPIFRSSDPNSMKDYIKRLEDSIWSSIKSIDDSLKSIADTLKDPVGSLYCKYLRLRATRSESPLPTRGLCSEPHNCQKTCLGEDSREYSQPLNATPLRSTTEKSTESLSNKTTRMTRSYTNPYLSAIISYHFFPLAGAAPVDIPDNGTTTSQNFQTFMIAVICLITFPSALCVWLAPIERWSGCLYFATLLSATMSMVVLNMGSDAETNQVWVVIASFSLYAAWLRRLSNTYDAETLEPLAIPMNPPDPGSSDNDGRTEDSESPEDPTSPRNHRNGFIGSCVGVLGALVFATYAASSFDSFPVAALPFLFPVSIFAVCVGYKAWSQNMLYVRTVPVAIRTALRDALRT